MYLRVTVITGTQALDLCAHKEILHRMCSLAQEFNQNHDMNMHEEFDSLTL